MGANVPCSCELPESPWPVVDSLATCPACRRPVGLLRDSPPVVKILSGGYGRQAQQLLFRAINSGKVDYVGAYPVPRWLDRSSWFGKPAPSGDA